MKKDALYYFSSPVVYFKFYQQLDIYNGWKIQKGLLNDRGKKIQEKPYTKTLREAFFKKGFFRRQVSIAEIVSWLDTMTIFARYLRLLSSKLEAIEFAGIKIYVEYMIQMSKKMRVDYVVEYKNRLLLLEFRTVSTFDKIRPTWDVKFRELLIYKELMGYYKPERDIILYAFISMYEYDDSGLIVKQRNYNDNQVRYLVEYTMKYLIAKKQLL